MTVDFTKWAVFLKLKPANILPVTIAAGFVLIAPKIWLDAFGLTTFVNNYGHWIGGAFVFSVATLLSYFIIWIAKIIKIRRKVSKLQKRIIKRINATTPREKDILKGYIVQNTKTQILDISDGAVKGLELAHIIYRAASTGDFHEGFAFNIQEFAWDYLNKNKWIFGLDD